MANFLIFVSLFFLWYIYAGYGVVLSIFQFFSTKHRVRSTGKNNSNFISIIIPVFNEEEKIGRKIEGIFSQNIDFQYEIVVVSDGSTDKTDEIVESYKGQGVKLLRTSGRVGKSIAQNYAVSKSKGEILILTDVAVSMEVGCINALIRPFKDKNVGCTSAHLLFRGDCTSDVNLAQGYYWNYELKIRRLESKLGILSTAAGPMMALRKGLWVDLISEYGDDCVLPLDVAIQGSKIIQVKGAIAWDDSFKSFSKEYSARVRMVIRNWHGTLSRRVLLNPYKHLGYSVSLFSHKILRWLSPLFLLVLGFGVFLYGAENSLWLPFYLYISIMAAGIINALYLSKIIQFKSLDVLSSFLIVNYAFFIGLVKITQGKVVGIYDNK